MMNTLSAFLRLARPLNLAIIALTQWLFWFYVIEPVYAYYDLSTRMADWQVFLLIVSTVLIAAGGYVINDYYDLPIDLVNKPEKVVISRMVSDHAAFNYYLLLTGLGIFAALVTAWKLGQPTLILLPVIVASLLWFYAQEFKRSVLAGNLIVAFSTAAVIFILLLFEIDWSSTGAEVLEDHTNEILRYGTAYMVFAFLLTMLREIVKDLQDMEGDRQFECRTLPIVAGEKTARAVAMVWLVMEEILLGILCLRFLNAGNIYAAVYIIVLLMLPGLVIGARFITASGPDDYRKLSRWIKGVMFFGIITMAYIGVMLGKHI
jgi:4-hydroxybenzoate polyprenyltransferase